MRVEVARDVRIGNLISVLDLLSRAGAASFSFATLEGGPIEDAATWSEDEPFLVKWGLATEVGFKLTVGTRTIVGRSAASPR